MEKPNQENFLPNRKHRVELNGKYSSWANIEAGVPEGSILGPLFFLIYINDLSDNLITNPKLFADDTSLFSIVHDPNATANDLNNDLAKINDWASNGKWILILTLVKKLRRFFFSRKIKSQNHPCLHFNNNPVNQTPLQKHIEMYLDPKLDFLEHLKSIQTRVSKSIALLRKLQTILPRPTLLTIYKAFTRPHLDYGDAIYDQTTAWKVSKYGIISGPYFSIFGLNTGRYDLSVFS